jgi:hypothetical protein
MLVLLAFGRQFAMSHAATPPDVADAVFSTLTSFLRWELRLVALLAALAALLLWATGPSSRARSMRHRIAATSGAAAKKVEGAMGEEHAARLNEGSTSVLGFIGTYSTAFIWTGVAIACLALVVWVDSLGGLIWTVVLTGLWVAGIAAAGRRFGSPAPPTLPGPA